MNKLETNVCIGKIQIQKLIRKLKNIETCSQKEMENKDKDLETLKQELKKEQFISE